MKLEEALKTTKFESIEHKAILNVMYTAYWYKAQSNALFKTFDLTGEQFNVMRILKGKHPEAMCVKDIASRMIEKSSNVPRIIDRMIAKQFAERKQSEMDRRETMVQLTAKGMARLEEASNALKSLTREIITLSEEDATVLDATLEKMRNTY